MTHILKIIFGVGIKHRRRFGLLRMEVFIIGWGCGSKGISFSQDGITNIWRYHIGSLVDSTTPRKKTLKRTVVYKIQ